MAYETPDGDFVTRGRSLNPIGHWTYALENLAAKSRIPAWSYVQVRFRRMNQKKG